ncbi:MAG: DUF2238 domain-containing protein, partial [Lysobacteraceae bacterium]
MLLAVYGLIWGALAVAPKHRADWWLENVLVFVAIPLLAWASSRLRLRDRSYVALFVFFVFHAIGSHYTYSEVPIDAWCEAWFGFSPGAAFGAERNHYDRLVHFLYG